MRETSAHLEALCKFKILTFHVRLPNRYREKSFVQQSWFDGKFYLVCC